MCLMSLLASMLGILWLHGSYSLQATEDTVGNGKVNDWVMTTAEHADTFEGSQQRTRLNLTLLTNKMHLFLN